MDTALGTLNWRMQIQFILLGQTGSPAQLALSVVNTVGHVQLRVLGCIYSLWDLGPLQPSAGAIVQFFLLFFLDIRISTTKEPISSQNLCQKGEKSGDKSTDCTNKLISRCFGKVLSPFSSDVAFQEA